MLQDKKTAYLISAYNDPEHLARLVRALDDTADFYVHIDARVDEAPFRRALPESVTFVRRVKVSWGGWSQVEYQAELLRAALDSGQTYSHLVTLSGQDYPLWSNAHIKAFLAENAEREIICGYNLTRGTSPEQRRKFTHIHPFRDLSWRCLWLKNKMIVASRHLLAWTGFRRRSVVNIYGRDCDVYFGADRWALTPECARYVLQTLADNPSVVSYFRTTFVPSEMCIQTLVFNSPFAARALHTGGEYPGLTALTPLHYIHYGEGIKVLTTADYETLKHCGKMFCRKVVSGASDKLVELLPLD